MQGAKDNMEKKCHQICIIQCEEILTGKYSQ